MQQHYSSEQQAAIDAATSGKSIFLTGGAGTGKSFTLKQLITIMHQKYSSRPGAVAVVAPTGAAAIQVEGTTIHNWFGFKTISQQEAPKLKEWKRLAWIQAQVLIIDEISMVSNWMLDLLDRMARESRSETQKHLPFAGIQLVFCGDFLQLPSIDGSYCFKSKAWTDAITRENCFELKYPYRQGKDQEFASILGQVRIGKVNQQIIDALTTCNKSECMNETKDTKPTRLYSKKANVDAENLQNLAKLSGSDIVFSAHDQGPSWALDSKKLSSWTNAPTQLSLKIGAQVVLLKNLDIQQGLVNGSRGVVVGFDGSGKPVIRFIAGGGQTITVEPAKWTLTKTDNHHAIIATRSQYPLDLAWAITIHKAQGMSLDSVYTDLSECFADGMAYVALSRCRTLQGLTVTGLSVKAIRANKEAIAFHESLVRNEPEQKRRKTEEHLKKM
jgi:ATP-dependent DNA helicase PIF1